MAEDQLQRQRQAAVHREGSKTSAKHRIPQHPVLGPSDTIGEGDSRILYDAFPSLGPEVFSELKNEVYWQKMYHAQGEVPRLVCAQGQSDPVGGSMPVYRHPSDHSLPLLQFSKTVQAIRKQVEAVVGHDMNHVLIQLYRTGHDNISEHSDKTLDIVRGSSIVNVSIGAQRTMRLRTKRSARLQDNPSDSGRQTQLVPMPHRSIFVLGPRTNMAWLHGINADKRPGFERSEEELSFGGERISMTFRHIGTFLDSESKTIWGQGACAKAKSEAHQVTNGDPAATQAMINAFGFENQQNSFDWDSVYGGGFDVLHFSQVPGPELPLLFLSGEHEDDLRVKNYLNSLDVSHNTIGVSREEGGRDYKPELCFQDNDAVKTQVFGEIPVMKYLERTFSINSIPRAVLAKERAYDESNVK